MLVAFRESLARIVELMIGVAAGVFLAAQWTDGGPYARLVVAITIVIVVVVGALVAAWIHTSRVFRPPSGG